MGWGAGRWGRRGAVAGWLLCAMAPSGAGCGIDLDPRDDDLDEGGAGGSGAGVGGYSGSSAGNGGQANGCPGAGDNAGEARAPSLAEPVVTNVDAQPYLIRAGDLTGDGRAEMVVVEQTQGGALVLVGDGLGGFEPALDLRLPREAGTAAGLELADLDDDGQLDLALGVRLIDPSLSGVVKVFWGGSSFPDEVTDVKDGELEISAITVAAGDLDGDGHVDLIAQSAVGLFANYGLGDRQFEPGVLLHEDDLTTLVMNAQAADLDGNGRAEAISSTASAGYRVYEVATDRTVRVRSLPGLAIAAAPPMWQDLDQDGDPDMLVPDTRRIYVAWNEGDGDFDFLGAEEFCTTDEASATEGTSPFVSLADLDDDGELDAVMSGSGDQLVFLYGQPDSRALGPAARLPAGEHNPGAVLTADFDGDGRPDLAVLHAHPGSLLDAFPLLVHLDAD